MKYKLHAFLLASSFANFAALGVSAAWADERSNFTVATGFDYSSGKYGKTDTTEILSIPVVGIYQTGAWILKVTVPYVNLTGTGDVVVGGRKGMATTTTTTRRTTQTGMGDVLAAVTYNIFSGRDDTLAVDVSGRIKFGTASTKLGTGENDYAAQFGLYKGLGRYTSITTLGYELVGRAVGTDLNNVTYATLGGDYKFTNRISGGAEMKASERYSATTEGQRELTIYANYRMDDDLNIRGYLLKGFADGSADTGFGMMISSGL